MEGFVDLCRQMTRARKYHVDAFLQRDAFNLDSFGELSL